MILDSLRKIRGEASIEELVRPIKAAVAEEGSVLFLFDDDSRMKIRTAAAVAASPGGSVKSVYETQAELTVESQHGSSATFRLADPGSSAAVRDKNDAMEYLG